MLTLEREAKDAAALRPPPAPPSIDTVLERLYGSLIEPQLSPGALDALRRLFAVDHVALIFRSADEPERINGMCICMDAPRAEFEARYLEHERQKDPFVNLPLDRPVALHDYFDEQAWSECDFYRQFLQPMGVFHVMGADLSAKDDTVCSLRLGRSRTAGRFQPHELAALGRLLPHLRQFVRLRLALCEARMAEQVLDALMGEMRLGAVVTDGHAKVVHRFGSAAALLRHERQIYVSAGELKAASAPNDHKLQRALREAREAAGPARSGPPHAILFGADRHGGALGVSVRGMPLADASGRRVPATVVVLREAEHEPDISEQNLQALFDFTAAEARVGRLLVKGMTVDEASMALHISRNTLRTHLRSMFAKTNTARQADLVRAMLAGTKLLC